MKPASPMAPQRSWAHALFLAALTLPLLAAAQPRGPSPQQWQDVRHGHRHSYPVTGQVVGRLPPHATVIVRGSNRYGFADGVWYTPRSGRYVVTRPPYGIVVVGLPAVATVVTIGALTYYYANNVYYRPLSGGRYEVVPPPVEEPPLAAAERVFVYPRQGQPAAQQASDEYECHRWASGQSGVDPTTAITGGPSASDAQRQDYLRATAACLEGRGYTVR